MSDDIVERLVEQVDDLAEQRIALNARIAELEAKIERLTSRGIEDMQARIAELEAETNRVEARLVEQRAIDMLCRHLEELRTALEEE
jgi:phage shock protein A